MNSSDPPACQCHLYQTIVVSLVDILTFLIGQPVIAGLLWISFMSNKTPDILNTNLGLFHGLQYLMSLVHFVLVYALPDQHTRFLRFVFVFAQIGGPTGLSFICIQRYVAVVYPASYPLLRTYRYCEVCAAAVWILSVPTAIRSFFFAKVPSPNARMMKDAPIFLMVAMILMMWQCSLRIMVMLRRRGPGDGRGKLHPTKKRAFRTIAATTAITITFYIPVALLQRFRSDDECDYECETTPRCLFLLSAASVVHPLFYLYTQRKLLTCLKKTG